jgi:hypothetical protein
VAEPGGARHGPGSTRGLPGRRHGFPARGRRLRPRLRLGVIFADDPGGRRRGDGAAPPCARRRRRTDRLGPPGARSLRPGGSCGRRCPPRPPLRPAAAVGGPGVDRGAPGGPARERIAVGHGPSPSRRPRPGVVRRARAHHPAWRWGARALRGEVWTGIRERSVEAPSGGNEDPGGFGSPARYLSIVRAPAPGWGASVPATRSRAADRRAEVDRRVGGHAGG